MTAPHLALMVLVNLAWSLNFIAVKLSVADLPPILTNALRFSLVLILLLPVLRPIAGQMRPVLLVAFLLGVVHFGTAFVGLWLADDVAPIAIAVQTNVAFATVLAVLFLGERVGWRRVVGLAFSFGGVVVLSFDPRIVAYLDAVAFVLVSAFVFAVCAILMRRLKDVPPLTLQAWIAVAAVPGSLILSAAVERDQIAALQTAGWLSYGGVVYSAIAASIVGHGGMYYLLQRYPVSVVSPYTLMTPLMTVVASILLLGETLTWRMTLGGLITMVGVTIITLRDARRGAPSTFREEASMKVQP